MSSIVVHLKHNNDFLLHVTGCFEALIIIMLSWCHMDTTFVCGLNFTLAGAFAFVCPNILLLLVYTHREHTMNSYSV